MNCVMPYRNPSRLTIAGRVGFPVATNAFEFEGFSWTTSPVPVRAATLEHNAFVQSFVPSILASNFFSLTVLFLFILDFAFSGLLVLYSFVLPYVGVLEQMRLEICGKRRYVSSESCTSKITSHFPKPTKNHAFSRYPVVPPEGEHSSPLVRSED